MSNTIDASGAAAARETARTPVGRFGQQQHGDSGIVLVDGETAKRTDIVSTMTQQDLKCPHHPAPTRSNGWSNSRCGKPVKMDPDTGESLGACGLHLAASTRAAKAKADATEIAIGRREASAPLRQTLAALGIDFATTGERIHEIRDTHTISFSATQFEKLTAALQGRRG